MSGRGGEGDTSSGRLPSPFVVGVGRSGTTLLRLMLDAHPELTIPPETGFVPQLIETARGGEASVDELLAVITGHWRWKDFGLESEQLRARFEAARSLRPAPVLRRFYELYAEQQGKSRWGDKTPGYAKHMPEITRVLDEARFIHIIRDGRDVALSRVNTLSMKPITLEQAARLWRRWIRQARRQGARIEHYAEVRYEELIAEPESVLRGLCEGLHLDFDPAMLDYHARSAERLSELAHDVPSRNDKPVRPAAERLAKHEATSRPPDAAMVAKWRTRMEPADQELFLAAAGDMLDELGYPRS